jgi:glucosamine-6-phosphate deaminase
MRVIIRASQEEVAKWVAIYLKVRILSFKPTATKPFVLGLPTGSSPLGVYQQLVKMYEKGEISFKHVITFNMDEYVGLPRDHPQSYHSFMWDNFFKHIDIKPENVNILDGNAKDLALECKQYEEKNSLSWRH